MASEPEGMIGLSKKLSHDCIAGAAPALHVKAAASRRQAMLHS